MRPTPGVDPNELLAGIRRLLSRQRLVTLLTSNGSTLTANAGYNLDELQSSWRALDDWMTAHYPPPTAWHRPARRA